ncbi:MAG: class I adenylate-forming enzyme family protein [Myxococcales bacterium]
MNYCDDLLRQCLTIAHRRFALELDTGHEISFGELRDRVERLASVLSKMGIGPGRSVIIHLHNCVDAIVLHMATQYVGARSCFVDALVQPRALAYYVRVTNCTLLVTRSPLDQIDARVLEQTPVLAADDLPLLAQQGSTESQRTPHDWAEDDVSYIYFTSGTTSEPKGVMLTPGNHANFVSICDRYWQPVNEASRHICYVPFSHGFGTIFLVPLALRTGSELYLLRAFHPVRVLEAILKHGITHIYGVPSHYQQLLRLPDASEGLKRIQMAFCAAAKLEHSLMLDWERITGTILCEGYGLIETCCGTTWRVGEPSRGTGHMGPCPDDKLIEFGIFDEFGTKLRAGESGQIGVRGKSLMKGYLESSPEVSRSDDWFMTGDKGYITEDRHLFMTGRIKDIINIAGIKVSPYEVEAVLQKHPAVAEVAVVAAPDPLYGEVVKAYVRTATEKGVSERDLIRFAAEHLMNFQVPKRIEFVDALPLTNLGKLDRKRLRELNPI